MIPSVARRHVQRGLLATVALVVVGLLSGPIAVQFATPASSPSPLPTGAVASAPATRPHAGVGSPAATSQPLTRDVQVLVLKYFPLTADGQDVDIGVTGDVGGPLAALQAKVNSMTANVAEALSRATIYHGYANPTASPDLSYTVVDTKEYHEAVPAIPSSLNPSYKTRPDYASILASVDICRYVADQGVDQVWIWAYNGPHQLDISESKMSGPYGDISNSNRLDDMPGCGRTYTVYTYNYGRGTAEAIHDHGHQLEAELSAIDSHLFQELFEGTVAHPAGSAIGRCGSVHNPPNASFEYDWANATANLTDCLDWDPDGLGRTSSIDCSTWGCTERSDTDNPQRNWILWWMQNFPGVGNTVTYQGRQMRDWWDVDYDFDQVMSSCRTLVLPCPTAGAAHDGATLLHRR